MGNGHAQGDAGFGLASRVRLLGPEPSSAQLSVFAIRTQSRPEECDAAQLSSCGIVGERRNASARAVRHVMHGTPIGPMILPKNQHRSVDERDTACSARVEQRTHTPGFVRDTEGPRRAGGPKVSLYDMSATPGAQDGVRRGERRRGRVRMDSARRTCLDRVRRRAASRCPGGAVRWPYRFTVPGQCQHTLRRIHLIYLLTGVDVLAVVQGTGKHGEGTKLDVQHDPVCEPVSGMSKTRMMAADRSARAVILLSWQGPHARYQGRAQETSRGADKSDSFALYSRGMQYETAYRVKRALARSSCLTE